MEVQTQVVAGMNYIFSMVFDIKTGPDCLVRQQRSCTNIAVYKPIGCSDMKTCLEIIREEEISCDSGNSIFVPSVPRVPAEPADPCSQDVQIGTCRAIFPRFFFHRESSTCKPFNYGKIIRLLDFLISIGIQSI